MPEQALRAGQVHVWKASLASSLEALGEMTAILSSAERERAGRFAWERDHARFISCRATLRLLLSRYLGVPPEQIAFHYEPRGKPALAGVDGWQFNVSHSGDLAAFAISRKDPVGIDIEFIGPDFPWADVAPDFACPGEVDDISALPTEAHPAAFFQLWTVKEAMLKAAGSGFSIDPRSIRLQHDGALNFKIVSAPPILLSASLRCFSLDEGYSSALAVLGQVETVSFFDF